MQVEGNRVVYMNLLAKHTLVESMRMLNAINETQYAVLVECCDLFLGNIVPNLIVYGSSDIQNPDTRCNSKTEFFLKRMVTIKNVVTEY